MSIVTSGYGSKNRITTQGFGGIGGEVTPTPTPISLGVIRRPRKKDLTLLRLIKDYLEIRTLNS